MLESTVELGAPTKVASVSVKAGFWKTEELWKANNQITGLDVITDDGRVLHATPPATMDAVEVAIGGAPVKRLDFKITKVKKGRMNDSCITGITLTTAPAAQLVLGADPELVAAIPRIERALSGCDEKELAAAIGFPFGYEPADDDEGKRAKPVEHRSAADLAKACKKRPDAVPKGGLPGINVFENKGMTYLHSANCGASPCYQWGFQKREGGWRLVWVGEGADNPYRK